MRLAMVTAKRTKGGLWLARKAIPEDVRKAYGKREEKRSWPAALSEAQVKAELADWLAPIEARIDLLRKPSADTPVYLTKRQCRALAGEWYRKLVETREAEFTDSSTVWDWDAEIEEICPEDEEAAHLIEPVSYRPIPPVVEARDALLREKGLTVTEDSAERLLQEMLELYVHFLRLMQRRCEGDFGPDPALETLPVPEASAPALAKGTPLKAQASAALLSLFDDYVQEAKPSPATVKAWRRHVQHLIDFLGHDDATKISRQDLIRWKDHLLKEGRSAKTVKDGYLPAISAVLSFACDNGHIETNPAVGIKVRGPKPVLLRDPSLSDEEAKTILKAALGAHPKGISAQHALARRWVPWICAYTGARVNEITQLRAEDIRMECGVWVLHITPEAGSVKTNKARSVPIHSHLLEQGILSLRDGRHGPIFYDPRKHRGGSDGNPQHKKVGERLATWVRSLGVDDPNVKPNHGWRHRFKTVARTAGLDPEAHDRITGHAHRSEGEAYGSWEPKALQREIEKLPRYEVG